MLEKIKLDAFDSLSQRLKKLCTDYSKTQKMEKKTAKETCLILEFLIEKCMAESNVETYYKLDSDLNRLLSPLYQIWIKDFWRNKVGLAADIIECTIKSEHMKLAEHLPMELCRLAEMFCTYTREKKYDHNYRGIYERDRQALSYQQGLSEKAEQYEGRSTWK